MRLAHTGDRHRRDPLCLLFQNFFVSLAVDFVVSDDDFDVIRGYNFVILSITWLVVTATYLHGWRERNRSADPFVKVLAALFGPGILFPCSASPSTA